MKPTILETTMLRKQQFYENNIGLKTQNKESTHLLSVLFLDAGAYESFFIINFTIDLSANISK